MSTDPGRLPAPLVSPPPRLPVGRALAPSRQEAAGPCRGRPRAPRAPRSGGRLVGLVAAAGVIVLVACAAGSEITVRDPWIRLTDPSRPLGGFMTIVNGGAADDALVGAESPAFGSIELHETVPATSEASPMPSDGMASPMPSDGMAMAMRPVAEIPIPAGGEQALQPGGYHLMLMAPKRSLAVGDTVELTLHFKSGRSVTIEAPVRAP